MKNQQLFRLIGFPLVNWVSACREIQRFCPTGINSGDQIGGFKKSPELNTRPKLL
jgi:hypothetical protein